MMRRFSLLFLLLLLLLPACRHSNFAHDGCFVVGKSHFVQQDSKSQQLCRNAKGGDPIGRIRATGIPVKLLPKRLGSYSRYSLNVWTEGGARGSAELRAHRGCNRCAIIFKNGAVEASRDYPAELPKDWVCLVALEGNVCIVAWNRKNGGYNHKFLPSNKKHGDAVYKLLEMDDPRYHHDGVPLREIN